MADIKVIDLNEMAKAYAENVLGVSSGKKSNSSTRRLKVNWDRVKFETDIPKFPNPERRSEPKRVIILKSTYTNKADEPQENTFSAQNTTKASTYVSLTQCFSIGEQTKLDLRMPEYIITAKSGFGHDLSVSHVGTQLFETQQTWSVNTKVQVPPHSERTAKLSIQETQYSAEFNVETVISGKVHVTVYDENDVFVQSLEPKDISQIVKSMRKQNPHSIPDFVEIKERTVCITSEGRCEFIYGKEQHVTTE